MNQCRLCRFFRWAYQAKVMKILEINRRATVRIDRI